MARDANGSHGCAGWFKWLAAIAVALLAEGSGLVVLFNHINSPIPPRALAAQPPTATPVVCYITGKVYDKETRLPLAGIEVSYLRLTEDGDEYLHHARSHLATTASDGHFEADCSRIEPENFPLRLTLSLPGWHFVYQTDEYIKRSEIRRGLKLYVRGSYLQTPSPYKIIRSSYRASASRIGCLPQQRHLDH